MFLYELFSACLTDADKPADIHCSKAHPSKKDLKTFYLLMVLHQDEQQIHSTVNLLLFCLLLFGRLLCAVRFQ